MMLLLSYNFNYYVSNSYLFMDLSFLFQALLQAIDRVLKISLLIFVLLLDVRVDFDILYFLVFNIGIQILIDCSFELIKVIDELNSSIYSICESLDEYVVRSYLRPVLLDQVLHVLLPCPKIIDDVTEIGIDLVVVLQVFVHFVSLLLKPCDFHLTRGNISLEFLDLVVEDELELLEFLSLLLQLVDLLLSFSNELVLCTDLSRLVLDLLLVHLQNFVLICDLDIFLLLISFELFYVCLEILVLILCQLQLSL